MIKRCLLGLAVLAVVTGMGFCASGGVEAGANQRVLGAQPLATIAVVQTVVPFGQGAYHMSKDSPATVTRTLDLWGQYDHIAWLQALCPIPQGQVNPVLADIEISFDVEETSSGISSASPGRVLLWDLPHQTTQAITNTVLGAFASPNVPPSRLLIGQRIVPGKGAYTASIAVSGEVSAEFSKAANNKSLSFPVDLLITLGNSSNHDKVGLAAVRSPDPGQNPRLTITTHSLGPCAVDQSPPSASPLCPGTIYDYCTCSGGTAYTWTVTGASQLAAPSSNRIRLEPYSSSTSVAITAEVALGALTRTYSTSVPVTQFPACSISAARTSVCPCFDGISCTGIDLTAIPASSPPTGVSRNYVWEEHGGGVLHVSADPEYRWIPDKDRTAPIIIDLYQESNGCKQLTPSDSIALSIAAPCLANTIVVDTTSPCTNEPYAVAADPSCGAVEWWIGGTQYLPDAGGYLDLSDLGAGPYDLLAKTSSGGCPGKELSLAISPCAAPVKPDFFVPPDLCLHETLELDAGPAYHSYTWTVNTDIVSTQQWLDYEFRTSGNHKLYLELATKQGCTDKFDWPITVPTVPSFDLVQDGPCCTNECGATISNLAEAEKIKWFLMVDGHEQYLDTDNHLRFTPPDGLGIVDLRAEVSYAAPSSLLCKVEVDGNLSVKSLPQCDIAGPRIACSSDQKWPYTVDCSTGSVSWSMEQGSRHIDLGSGKQEEITFPWPGDWIVKVEAKDGDCGSTAEYEVAVKECSAGPIRVPPVLCCGSTSTFALIGPPGMTEYAWQMTDSDFLGRLENSDNEHATWSCESCTDKLQHVVFQLDYTDDDGCAKSAHSDSTPVVCIPPLTIVAPSKMCPDSSSVVKVEPADIGTSLAPCVFEWNVDGTITEINECQSAIRVEPWEGAKECNLRVRASMGDIHGPWTAFYTVPIVQIPDPLVIAPASRPAKSTIEIRAADGLENIFWEITPSLGDLPSDETTVELTIDEPGQYLIKLSAYYDGCKVEHTHILNILPQSVLEIRGSESLCAGQQASYTVSPMPSDLRWVVRDTNQRKVHDGAGSPFYWTPDHKQAGSEFFIEVSGRAQNQDLVGYLIAHVGQSPNAVLRRDDLTQLKTGSSVSACTPLKLHVDSPVELVDPEWRLSVPSGGYLETFYDNELEYMVPQEGPLLIEMTDNTSPCPVHIKAELKVVPRTLKIICRKDGKEGVVVIGEHTTTAYVGDDLQFMATEGFDEYVWDIAGEKLTGNPIRWPAPRSLKGEAVLATVLAKTQNCKDQSASLTVSITRKPLKERDIVKVIAWIVDNWTAVVAILTGIIGLASLKNWKKAWAANAHRSPVGQFVFAIIDCILAAFRPRAKTPPTEEKPSDNGGGGGGGATPPPPPGPGPNQQAPSNYVKLKMGAEGSLEARWPDQPSSSAQPMEADQPVASADASGSDDQATAEKNDTAQQAGSASKTTGPAKASTSKRELDPPCVYGHCTIGHLSKRGAAVGATVTATWPGGSKEARSDENGDYVIKVPATKQDPLMVDITAIHPGTTTRPSIAPFQVGEGDAVEQDIEFT